ncbi:C-type lectin 37Db-like [Ceratitis capitata]|uniref:C-type lectin 37Db-like n=1 Tax=Ceratitis capitata TaxID=7213 RepID=UPI000C6C6DC1|nr:C-type lectin 37Db-like [Ceratitis capitata]
MQGFITRVGILLFVVTNFNGLNADSNCAEGFFKLGEKCYLIKADTRMNWYQASHFCRQHNSDLAVIESESEMQSINDYLVQQKYFDSHFWIDASDLATEGEFVYHSTGQPMNYSRWSVGQPDNYKGQENCVRLWYTTNGFYMNDGACFTEFAHPICALTQPFLIFSNQLFKSTFKNFVDTFFHDEASVVSISYKKNPTNLLTDW